MKILIAEDEVTSRIMLEQILAKWGYEEFCQLYKTSGAKRHHNFRHFELVNLQEISPFQGQTKAWSSGPGFFTGLGHLGKAIAGRLLECGHTLTAWNRTASKAEGMQVEVASFPIALTNKAEIIFKLFK